jgi:KaiC/GvpD/RAD55 family RecA-like ATPase
VTRTKPTATPDRLPPHDEAAEHGVLGCCLLDGNSVERCLERFALGDGRCATVFFDLRNQEVFEALVRLYVSGRARDGQMDLLLVQSELGERFEALGGHAFLMAVQDSVPSALNLESYAGIVWGKFVERQMIQQMTRTASEVQTEGLSEGALARIEREMGSLTALVNRKQGIAPEDLKQPGAFAEECYHLWFHEKLDEAPGLELPFSFPLRIRPAELTLVCGEDGSGKSIFCGQLAVALMKQGWRGFLASFEVKSSISLWMMQRQILGTGPRMPKSEENERRAAGALAWLNARLWIYDFFGITDWRLLLDVMGYAAERCGVNFFVIDSLMRLGIAEDDLAAQSVFMAKLGAFTVATDTHVFLVHHLNKTREAALKSKVTGSKRITDNANNIVEMQRNAKKKEKLDELQNKLEADELSEAEFRTKTSELIPEKDAKFLLGKQRYPGTPQNGSKWLWFDERSLQFRDNYQEQPVNYLL